MSEHTNELLMKAQKNGALRYNMRGVLHRYNNKSVLAMARHMPQLRERSKNGDRQTVSCQGRYSLVQAENLASEIAKKSSPQIVAFPSMTSKTQWKEMTIPEYK